MTGLVDLGDEVDVAAAMRAELEARGYLDVDHDRLRPGARVRHRGERWSEAVASGTGVVVAVMELPDSSWSRSWGGRDIELLVLKDKPLLPGMTRLAQLADYHVAVAEVCR